MTPDFVVVGLGNPQEKYDGTRHNVGKCVLDTLVDQNDWMKSKSTQAEYAWTTIGERRVELIKPMCFYNETGSVVGHVLKKHNLSPNQLVVVHDDVDLNFGDVKKVVNRGSGGNKGVESIISAIGSKDFTRIRIGVIPQNWLGNFKKPNKYKIPDFVLKPFSKKEQKQLESVIEKAVNLLSSE